MPANQNSCTASSTASRSPLMHFQSTWSLSSRGHNDLMSRESLLANPTMILLWKDHVGYLLQADIAVACECSLKCCWLKDVKYRQPKLFMLPGHRSFYSSCASNALFCSALEWNWPNSQHHTFGKRARRGGEKEGKDSWVEVCVCVCVWKREARRRNEKHFWWRMFTLKSACDITVWISINVSSRLHVQLAAAEGSRTLNAPRRRTGQRDGARIIGNTSPNGETAWRLCVCCGSAAVRCDAGMM